MFGITFINGMIHLMAIRAMFAIIGIPTSTPSLRLRTNTFALTFPIALFLRFVMPFGGIE